MRKNIKKRILICTLPFFLLTGCNKNNNEQIKMESTKVTATDANDEVMKNCMKFDFYSSIYTANNNIYDANKDDSEIIEIPEDYRISVLCYLGKNKEDKVTVGDLKQMEDLNIAVTDQDLSWLNYCANLKSLYLNYAYKVDSAKNIEVLPSLNHLSIYNLTQNPIELSNESFDFAYNIDKLDLTGNIIYSAEDLEKRGVKDLSVIGNNCNNINYKDLFFLDKIDVDVTDDSPYDTAIFFTNEDKDYLTKNGVEVTVGNKVQEIDKRLEEINKSIDIKETDSDREKYEKIVMYVIKKLHYPENHENLSGYYEGGNLYSALEGDGEAICGNYSSLVQALCVRNNIETYTVISSDHVWNIVNIDNDYYYSDITNMDYQLCCPVNGVKGLTCEEYINGHGIDENVRYFLFNQLDCSEHTSTPLYLPEEYRKYEDTEAFKYLKLEKNTSTDAKEKK